MDFRSQRQRQLSSFWLGPRDLFRLLLSVAGLAPDCASFSPQVNLAIRDIMYLQPHVCLCLNPVQVCSRRRVWHLRYTISRCPRRKELALLSHTLPTSVCLQPWRWRTVLQFRARRQDAETQREKDYNRVPLNHPNSASKWLRFCTWRSPNTLVPVFSADVDQRVGIERWWW